MVGYAIGRSIDTRLALAALTAALASRRPPAGCICHTDRGSQYASARYRQLLADHGLVGSMSRRGNPFDKDDVEKLEVSLRGDIDHLRGDMEHLRGDMKNLETSLRADMEKMVLRTDLEKTEAKMMGEMSKLAHRLTVRLGGAIGAGVGILVAVDKLL